jgi:hypothetical protein
VAVLVDYREERPVDTHTTPTLQQQVAALPTVALELTQERRMRVERVAVAETQAQSVALAVSPAVAVAEVAHKRLLAALAALAALDTASSSLTSNLCHRSI